MAWRICLIKLVFSSIWLFYMYLFKIPSAVANELVRLQRDFLWDEDMMEERLSELLGKRCVNHVRPVVLVSLTYDF